MKKKHYKFQDKYLQLVKYKYETLEEMKNDILKLIDGNKLVNIFEADPGNFIKLDRNLEKEEEKKERKDVKEEKEKKDEKEEKYPTNPSKPNFFNILLYINTSFYLKFR